MIFFRLKLEQIVFQLSGKNIRYVKNALRDEKEKFSRNRDNC